MRLLISSLVVVSIFAVDLERLSFPSSSEFSEAKAAADKDGGLDYYSPWWTGYSYNYGGCGVDTIVESASPMTRYSPMKEEMKCQMHKCESALKGTERYKVCAHVDHPRVAVSKKTAQTNFLRKLKDYPQKMLRFHKHIEERTGLDLTAKLAQINFDHIVEGDVSHHTYKELYATYRKLNFTEYRPDRGWASYSAASCTTSPESLKALLDHAKDTTDVNRPKKWTDHNGVVRDFLDVTTSTCEWSEDKGVFHHCSQQSYISVNIRCDPRFELLVHLLADKNNIQPSDWEDLRIELEVAHHNGDGKVQFSPNLHMSGGADTFIPSPYLAQQTEGSTCKNNCPIPTPWTEWTCSCNRNSASAPRCCGRAERKRFRGCADLDPGDEISCSSLSQAIGGSPYVSTCADGFVHNANDVRCASTVDNKWHQTDWIRGADLRYNKVKMSKKEAVDIIVHTWVSNDILTKYNVTFNQVVRFLYELPSLNLEDPYFTTAVHLKCITDRMRINQDHDEILIDAFTDCILNDEPAWLTNSTRLNRYLKTKASTEMMKPEKGQLVSGEIQWNKIATADQLDDLNDHRTNVKDYAEQLQGILQNNISRDKFNNITEIEIIVRECVRLDLIYNLNHRRSGIDARDDKLYYRHKAGTRLSLDVKMSIDLTLHSRDPYYQAHLQNFYADSNYDMRFGSSRRVDDSNHACEERDPWNDNWNKGIPELKTSNYMTFINPNCVGSDIVRCDIAHNEKVNDIGYEYDQKQRSDWNIVNGVLTLSAYNGPDCMDVYKDTDPVDCRDVSEKPCFALWKTVADWYNSFDLRAEIGLEVEECDPEPAPVNVEDKTCVAGFQHSSSVTCGSGYEKGSLVKDIADWPTGPLRVYWQLNGPGDCRCNWGMPTKENHDPNDFDGQNPTADYVRRYANFGTFDFCDWGCPVPKSCSIGCVYDEWSSWGEWSVNVHSFDASVEQSVWDTTAPSGANSGSVYLDPVDDYGTFQTESQQCFRVFQTAESMSNVVRVMQDTRLRLNGTIDIVLSDDVRDVYHNRASMLRLQYDLTIYLSWFVDGLYMDRNHIITLATIEQLNAVLTQMQSLLGNADLTTIPNQSMSSFQTKLYRLNLYAHDLVFRGNKYNFDMNRYEYIGGFGNLTLPGGEGWHLDVLKKWLEGVDGLRPHGWRFTCRHRNDDVQGYKARFRNHLCGDNAKDCCGLIDLQKCDLPICPDWREWTPWTSCSKSCMEGDGNTYGYKARSRSCETSISTTTHQGLSYIAELPERRYSGCICNHDYKTEDIGSACQSKSFFDDTAQYCTAGIQMCNTEKPCPIQSNYTVVEDCPACGTSNHIKVSKLSCLGPDLLRDTTDWDTTKPYTSDDCKYDKPEYTSEVCPNNPCTYASETACVDGVRTIVQNGELFSTRCRIEKTFSNWTSCRPSCLGRPRDQSFRWSNYGDIQQKPCPQPTEECPHWSIWNEWSSCPHGTLYRNRSRTCINNHSLTPAGYECAGDSTQFCSCP